MEVESFGEAGIEKLSRYYTRGEIDFVYGKYTGKGGGDFKQGYILGEVGSDKFRFSVGASYGESSGGRSYWGR